MGYTSCCFDVLVGRQYALDCVSENGKSDIWRIIPPIYSLPGRALL